MRRADTTGTGAALYASCMDVFSLEGRRALVTGRIAGIGAATAVALDRAGARVALSGRDEEALELVAAGLENEPVVLVADLAIARARRRRSHKRHSASSAASKSSSTTPRSQSASRARS